MIWIGYALGLGALLLTWLLTFISPEAKTTRSGLSPYLFLFIYTFSAQLDYISFQQNGFGVLAQRMIRASDQDLGIALVHHNAILLAAIFGIFFGQALGRPLSPVKREIRRGPTAVFLGFVCALYLLPIVTAVAGGVSIFELGVDAHRVENRDPVSFLYAILMPPLLAGWLTTVKPKAATLACIVLAVLLLGTGSRSRVLYVVLCYAFYLAWYADVSIRRHLVLIGTMAAIIVATGALNYRQAIKHGWGIESTIQLFDPSSIFETPDFPMAEAGVLVVQQPVKLQPFPLEEFVGAALSPIPRALVPFKPEDGSAQFTRTYDSDNFYRYGRGLTVGSIIELKTGYGFFGAMLFSALLAAVWAFFIRRSSGRGDAVGFLLHICSYLVIYNFLRNDLQNAGQILAVFAFTIVMFTRPVRQASPRNSSPAARQRSNPPHRTRNFA